MTVFFQDPETEDVIFQTEDSPIVPNVGESVRIENKWYDVVERSFNYEHLVTMDSNSCTIWVKRSE